MVVIGTLGASAVSRRIIDEKVYFSQVPLNHHLAQLSVAVGENLFPLQQYPAVTLDELRKLNQRLPEPSQLYGFFFGVYYQRLENMFPRLASDDFDALRDASRQAVRNHFRESLSIRWHAIKNNLARPTPLGFGQYGIPRSARSVELTDLYGNDPMVLTLGLTDLSTSQLPVARSLFRGVAEFSKQYLPLGPNGYLLVALLGLIASRLAIGHLPRLEALLFTCALFHLTSVLLVVSHYEFRWGHQSIYLSVLAICLLAKRTAERHRKNL